MFYGYVYLAKKMKENNVELNKLENILNTIDFSKSGRVFEELGRQNNENQLKNIMKKKLKRMFYDEIAVV